MHSFAHWSFDNRMRIVINDRSADWPTNLRNLDCPNLSLNHTRSPSLLCHIVEVTFTMIAYNWIYCCAHTNVYTQSVHILQFTHSVSISSGPHYFYQWCAHVHTFNRLTHTRAYDESIFPYQLIQMIYLIFKMVKTLLILTPIFWRNVPKVLSNRVVFDLNHDF